MKKSELIKIIKEEISNIRNEAIDPVAKAYKPGDKIRIKKYNNFEKKKETIDAKVESVKNGVIKYTYTNFAGQQWGSIKVGDKNIIETSASGNAGAYMTPKAFTKPGQDYEGSPAANAMKDWTKTKRIDEAKIKAGDKIKTKKQTSTAWYSPNTEYKVIVFDDGFYSKKPGAKTTKGFIPLKDIETNINEQVDFKDENFSPKQKMAQAIRTVRESLKEVEKIVDKSRVFKEENNIKSIDMYKRSHQALKKIGEQMNRIANKMQAIK